MSNVIGLDVGGTKILGVAAPTAEPTAVRDEERAPTPAGADAVLDALAGMSHRLDPDGTATLGVGMPGLVDRDGRFRVGPNLPDLVDVDVAEALSVRTGRRVVVDNDATCATRAEFHAGAGVGHADGVLVTLGTGIGGGIVADGVVRRGAHGFAGEIGHMVVDRSGPECPCGRHGCWEIFASGSGLGRLSRVGEPGRMTPAAAIAEFLDVEPGAIRGEDIMTAARAGNPDARSVLTRFGHEVAIGLADLVELLDPGIIVLGGGLVEDADLFLDRVEEALSEELHGWRHRPRVPVVVARFGDRAGAVGAAVTAAGKA